MATVARWGSLKPWLGLWPFPVRESSNKIIIRTTFITVFERLNLKLLKGLECLKHASEIDDRWNKDYGLC